MIELGKLPLFPALKVVVCGLGVNVVALALVDAVREDDFVVGAEVEVLVEVVAFTVDEVGAAVGLTRTGQSLSARAFPD
jgi:hypothetical protein